MSRYDLTAGQRRNAARDAAITNAETLAWAKATLERFPFRDDLRALIADAQASTLLIGTAIYDRFGAWTLQIDRDGNWFARQGRTEVLILDRADMNRFGIECLPVLA